MLPLWTTYYAGCDLLMYVVDVGNPATMAASAVQLYKMLDDQALKVLSRALSPFCQSRWHSQHCC